MTRLSLRSVWARKRRLLSTCVAIVIGVAFLSGTLIFGDTLNRNFTRLFTNVSARTDVVVRNGTTVSRSVAPDSGRGLIDAALLDTIRSNVGVSHAEAQIVGYGTLLGADGGAIGGNGPPRQAGSWITDPGLNPYRLVDGRAPTTPEEVVINRGAAKSGGLHVGDTTVVQTPDPVTVTIVGIATFGGTDGVGATTWTAFSMAGATEHVTGQPGKVSTILVTAAPGSSSNALRDRIAAELPSGVQAITGKQLAAERINDVSKQFLDKLRTFLVMFSIIALLVATLTISNTFSITVAQRTRELALLRAVGASQRQVRRAVAVEALVVGGVASALGVGAGVGVAGLLKGMFDMFGGSLPAGGMTVRPASAVIALVVGVAVTLAAALLPARRAARIAPVAALREHDGAEASRSSRRALLGAGLALVGVIGCIVAVARGSIALVAPAGAALVAATVTLAPFGISPVAQVADRLVGVIRGPRAHLAAQNARRNPRRSAATAMPLVVGVAVVTLFTVFAASLRASIDDQVRSSFGADLAINTATFGGGRLSPRMAADLTARPEVARAVAVSGGPVLLAGRSTAVTATDAGAIGSVVKLSAQTGSLSALGTDGVAVSTRKAHDEGWAVGTTLAVTFADGATSQVTVRAEYAPSQIVGGVLLPEALWNAHTTQPTGRTVFVVGRAGVDARALRRAITPLASRYGGEVQDRAEYAAATTGGLDILLRVVYALLALAVLIAVLGIANALSLAVHERRREIGLLRAVGQSRRHARSVLRLESLIIAGFGTGAGIVVGGLVGFTLYGAVPDTVGYAVPSTQLVIIAVIGTATGALAARRPARRAASLAILDAIGSV